MKFRQFLSVVPRSVMITAYVLAGCALLAGLTGGLIAASSNREVLWADRGLLAVMIGGGFLAILAICLGYVYEDARRRAMPPVLWTLVALLVPNLLGFLLYFAIRRPIAVPCPQCGQGTTADHRFCSWCGYDGSRGTSAPLQPPASGISSGAAV